MAIQSASNIQMDYMKLLVAQLQNQNPLEPLDNNQMASQLALFSQLEQLESLNSSFEKVLVNTKMSYANSLVGKPVGFFSPEDGTPVSGVVEEVVIDGEQVLLKVGDYLISLESVEVIGAE